MPIKLPFKKLSRWQQIAFAAALIERMLPNYALFSESCQFGDSNVLRNQLDLIWQKLSATKIKINTENQLEKLEEQIPEVEAFDSYGVYPALDTCMALHALLQNHGSESEEAAFQVSQLSAGSVSSYIELLFAQESQSEVSQQQIDEQPLMQWEKAMQSEIFDFLKQARENKQSIEQVKAIALEEGLSNLGISIND